MNSQKFSKHKNASHTQNIITLIYCIFLLAEFAENGSVYDYIHVQRKHPSMEQRLLWLKQVAEGTAGGPIKVSHYISSTFTPQVEAPLG